jgi:putative ABC transport system ATP-binding protein
MPLIRSKEAMQPPAELATAQDALSVRDLHREYRRGSEPVHALRGVNLTFTRGTFTAVMGPSGCGKTTLLHCLAGMDRPTTGTVHWGSIEVSSLRERRLAELRRSGIGFVFQAYNLMPAMTVLENVVLPARLGGQRIDWSAARSSLQQVGLAGCEGNRPGQLSGGQQQRVTIARALFNRPRLLFADEPTGALDRATGREILWLLREGVENYGETCVMVTHDPLAASFADRVIVMTDGKLVEDLDHPSAAVIAERLSELSC